MIRAENIHKRYGEVEVLKGVDLVVGEGEIIAILGASGAGKTTLLQILGTIELPSKGAVLFGNEDLFRLSDKKLAAFRNQNIGFVFQFHHLLPEFSVTENIIMPALIRGDEKRAAVGRANELLSFLDIANKGERKPDELSGGEQQRVAVARALINQPKVILADEPSGNLDSKNARELHLLFARLKSEFNQTFVLATHNEELASMSDRKLTITDGILG